MPQAVNKPEKLRDMFLVLFIASTVVVLLLMLLGPVVGNVFTLISSSLSPAPPVTPSPPQNSDSMGSTVLVGSIITSVTSLIGFITTTVITWRKEKREASLAEVQRKKLETELEKSKLELEELKKSKEKKRKK